MSDQAYTLRGARVIPAREADYAPWEPPAMDEPPRAVGAPTAAQIERLQQQAREEGFAQGRAEALAAVREPLEAVLRALARPLADLDEAAERELLALVMACARQLVRRELKTDPGEIVGCVREALAALPAAARRVRVHLHPGDAELVRSALHLEGREGEHGFVLVEDATLTRGGCRVTTETSQIDATLETRLAAVAARLLGGSAHMMSHHAELATRWSRRLRVLRARLEGWRVPLVVEGRLTRMVGLTLEAVGCSAAIGGRCLVRVEGGAEIEAEVVGFAGEKLYLMPTGESRGLTPAARVIPTQQVCTAPVGEGLLGRVLDGAGRPLDGRGALAAEAHVPLTAHPVNPMARRPIREPLDVGVRAINALLTVGRGQRLGLFAGSGVGKSVLLGMMTRFTTADVAVVAMIGERGREVKEFIENILGREGMRRAVVVAAPSDDPPLKRLHGALLAHAIAEYFRDQGRQVLLLMDSLTRFAQAQREIGLAIGEPPATKGYPPSVFARLPQLVERAGNGEEATGGSITAFYTVLSEGDDPNDPIADAARATLDGHITLSRRLAEAGHYPAIDIEASISRVMTDIVERTHLEQARRFRRLYSTYEQHRDLISVGAYHRGSDPRVDEAIEFHPRLLEFLCQDMNEAVSLADSLAALQRVVSGQSPPIP